MFTNLRRKNVFLTALVLTIAMIFLPNVSHAANVEVEPNNSLTTATPIELGTWYSGNTTTSGDTDYFKFTIPADGKVEVFFNNDGGSRGEPAIYIQDGKGNSFVEVKGSADLVGDESAAVSLPKGDYYIKILHYIGYSYDYKIKAEFTAGDYYEKEFNDNLSTATPIEVGKEYTGNVAKVYNNDYFKFSLSESGKFTACINTAGATNPGSKNLYLSILDGETTEYVEINKDIYAVNDECVNIGLDAGEYFIKIDPQKSSGYDYRLNTKFTATSFYEKEKNDRYSSANSIKMNQKYSGDISSTSDKDYFKFTLPHYGKVNLKLNFDAPDSTYMNAILLDEKGNQFFNYRSYGDSFKTSEALPAGEYYVSLQGNRNSSYGYNYSFSVFAEKVERIKGDNRYKTAVEISKAGWNSADTVILTRGDNFADALAGVPLAYQIDAPILMTQTNKLYDETLKEIKRLGAKNAIILGGTGAINDDVKTNLETNGVKVERIAGSNRNETAALIAEKMAPKGTNKAVVANGLDFPDALSVASYAAKEGMPILLTQAAKLPKATDTAIKELGVKETVVVGGAAVVSENIKKQLPKATRLSGKDRYETNIAIAKYFGLDSEHLYVATGNGFADALTGAVLSAKNDSAIILVHHKVPGLVSNYLKAEKPAKLSVFGGKGAVSDTVVNELNKLVK